jgi:beta-lactam-binding protein with PASTA domain
VVTQSPAAGTTFSGSVSVTLTVTDASGNDASTSFNVNVLDTTAPTIDGIADQTVSGNASCEGVVADYTSLAVVADNSDATPVVTQSPAAGTTFSGSVSVTLTVTDASGNDASTSFNVNVLDTTAPIINPITDRTVASNANCEANLPNYTPLAVVSDNCDTNPVLTQVPAPGTLFAGTILVTITATDASGNASSTSFNVTVEDTIDPTIQPLADQIVSADLNCEAIMADYTSLAVVSDNCDATPVVTQAPIQGTVFAGTIEVTLTVTDASGNSSSTSFDVTVEDTLAPVIECPEDFLVTPDENGNYILPDLTIEAIAFDNCTLNPLVTQIPAPGTVFTEGSINTITLIATDDAGNSSECSFQIEVDINLTDGPPAFNASDIILYPSPAENYFMIQNNSTVELTKLEIYDIRGRLITTDTIGIEGNSKQYDVSRLAGGVYWVTIFAEKGKLIKRLVIK